MSMMRGQPELQSYTIKLATLEVTNVNESSAMALVGTDVPKIAETFHIDFNTQCRTRRSHTFPQLPCLSPVRTIGAVYVVPVITSIE